MKKFKIIGRLNKDIMKNVMSIIIKNNHKIIRKGIHIVITNVRDYKEINKETTNIFTIVLEMFREETRIVDVLDSRAEDSNPVIMS